MPNLAIYVKLNAPSLCPMASLFKSSAEEFEHLQLIRLQINGMMAIVRDVIYAC